METTELTVVTGGERLDRYVSEHLPDLSRAAVQRLIENGNILVAGRVRKASYRVQAGETISVSIPPPESSIAQPETIPLDIIHEDENVIVVNKPAGMVVHPAAGHSGGTLVNAVLAHAPNLNVGGVERPGIVHRLDSETSGLIVVAKNDAALRDLQAQFKARRVHKTYLALVQGPIKPPRGKIDAPIGRDPKHRQRMAVVTHGTTRESVTIYRTIANLEGCTLIEAEPQTGRTHQIRVHLAFMGFPVVGDAVYGKRKNALGLTRHFLHAWKLALTLPDGRPADFTAPLPEDLRAVLEGLGFDYAAIGM
ncbi:MAG: RluA family pseudouridine synthase [Chloroflexi bacterium]|nr:RluA family pseudouridine synthase [Chloroflexota bacterium]